MDGTVPSNNILFVPTNNHFVHDKHIPKKKKEFLNVQNHHAAVENRL